MQLSLEVVREMARLLRETGLEEIAVENSGEPNRNAGADGESAAGESAAVEGWQLRLKSGTARVAVAPATASALAQSVASHSGTAQPATQSPTDSAANLPATTSDGKFGSGAAGAANETSGPAPVRVAATAVGLFRQTAPPLSVGDSVRAGQVVAVVESLKIPNEIAAPVAGQVAQFFVEDGQGVEYGQPLLEIAPA